MLFAREAWLRGLAKRRAGCSFRSRHLPADIAAEFALPKPAGTESYFDLITEGALGRDGARGGPTEQEEIMTKELWLRVHDDGREECYDHDPAPIQALHVVVTDGVEETWTSDREVRSGWQEPVPPPGKGWEAAGGNGGSTLWRRVTDGVEERWTSDRVVRPDWREPAPPPGKGWKATGGTGDRTLWRRTRLEP